MKVKDVIPPKLKVPDIDVRATSVNIESEAGSIINATYNGKEVSVQQLSDTSWKVPIVKPQLNKSLVITSTDASGNTTKVTKKSVKPNGLLLMTSIIDDSDKYIKNLIGGAKSTDKIYLVVGFKKYKGSIKGEKYTIKNPKIPTPTTVKIQLFDKFGNLLASTSL